MAFTNNFDLRRKNAKRIFKVTEPNQDDSESANIWVEPDVPLTTQIKKCRVSNRNNQVSLTTPEYTDLHNDVLSSTPVKTEPVRSDSSRRTEIEQLFQESDYIQGICPEDLNHTFNTTFPVLQSSKLNDSCSFNFGDINFDKLSQDKPEVNNRMLNWLPERFWEFLKEDRGISDLYEWQRDCLTLATTYRDWNLIYSLPTSGGKTLVAEIVMLEALLVRELDAVLVLPYVSLVQEKVRGLSTLASELGFNLEEYAGSKGALPPRKRKRRCMYVCTIEKANSLTSALQDDKRLEEIGVVVVDELHMIGEEGGRGACLEACLAKIMHCGPKVRIVGMSATLANIQTIASFLNAKLYTSDFRPVTLREYFKLGQTVFRVNIKKTTPTLQLDRVIPHIASGSDPDNLTGLVTEVIPDKSCLIFCASKANCENVAILLTTQLDKKYRSYKKGEKKQIMATLAADASGICPVLTKTIPYGIAYHHSGLTSEERKVIEEGFLSGTLCVLTCTSTLAAGVNLPASRVIIRSPYTGTLFLTRTRYVQMVGRAGRAGFGEEGESYVIGESKDKRYIIQLMSAPIEPCASTLLSEDRIHLRQLLLSAIGLKIANTEQQMLRLLDKTLLASCIEGEELRECVMKSIIELHDKKLIWAATSFPDNQIISQECKKLTEIQNDTDREVVYDVTHLGKAVYKSSIHIDTAGDVLREMEEALTSMILTSQLHLLYLLIPPDLVFNVKPDWKTTFNLVTGVEEDKLIELGQRVKVNPGFLTKLMTGGVFNSTEQEVTYRKFYLSLLIHRIVSRGEGETVWNVADEFSCSRGFIQSLLSSSAARCSCLIKFSEQIQHLWPLHTLFPVLLQKLAYASRPELVPLMELSGVGQGLARKLVEAGFNSIKSIARADPQQVRKLKWVGLKQARQIVSSAKLLLQEKAEALREEADELISLEL